MGTERKESMRVMGTVMGTGREPGILLEKKICRRQLGENRR